MSSLELLTIGETMVLVSSLASHDLTSGDTAAVSAGGAESNVAIGAAVLGVTAAWYSRVGSGPLGRLVADSVARYGVDTSFVDVDAGHPTGLMIKHASAEGSRVDYYRTGSAAAQLSPTDVGRLPAARVVHMSGVMAAISPSCRALTLAVVEGAVAHASTSFDVNYRPSLWGSREEAAATLLDLARRADVVFVGLDEAELLWGTVRCVDVRALLPAVSHLIVKDGATEAVEFVGTDVFRVGAHAVDVVEPVGAGDAFAAGWLASWFQGGAPKARLQKGHDLAAAVLQTSGDVLPHPDDLPQRDLVQNRSYT